MTGSRAPEPVVQLWCSSSAAPGRSGRRCWNSSFATLPGYFGMGEVIYIWSVAVSTTSAAAVGSLSVSVPLRTDVLDLAFGGLGRVPAERILESQRYVLRMRHLPLLRFPWLQPPTFRRHVRLLHHAYSSLYAAVGHQAGAQVLVDSSKIAAFGYLIGSVPG